MTEKQFAALAEPVEDWALKKSKNVHGIYTSGEFVTHKLNQIFTPGGWSFTIKQGPEVITINEANAYVRLVGRLSVRFGDGTEAHQDDIGIWPLRASNIQSGGTLVDTAAERYETVEKAARTDCLKNAARNFGTCFAPLGDLELVAAKRRADYEHTEESAEESIAQLYGDAKPPDDSTEPKVEKPTPKAKKKTSPKKEKVEPGGDPNWSWFWTALKKQGYSPDDVHRLEGFGSVKQWMADNKKTLAEALATVLEQLKLVKVGPGEEIPF